MALATVERLIGELVTEKAPVILDLMAGWDSHIPDSLFPSRVIGLGLNENELRKNPALTEIVMHDLNKDPVLPFPDNTFDAVINTVSVDYMTHLITVFKEVVRILKPGGLFLVIFSNRMFPQKAIKLWREASEEERVILVEEFFQLAELFEKSSALLSKGRPRPKDDKYACTGLPSDPVYAVYAQKKGGDPFRKPRPVVRVEYGEPRDENELRKRKRPLKTHCAVLIAAKK